MKMPRIPDRVVKAAAWQIGFGGPPRIKAARTRAARRRVTELWPDLYAAAVRDAADDLDAAWPPPEDHHAAADHLRRLADRAQREDHP